MVTPFVAVHTGAGCLSESTGRELSALCRSACREAAKLLRAGKDCREAVAATIALLENSPLTNAGRGSNLTLTGTVECDAGMMDGRGEFGAVAAAPGVANPILVAWQLLEQSSRGCLPLGRVPPLVLAGEGVQQWARQHGIPDCHPDDLITDRARQVYLDHKARLDGVTQLAGKRRRVEEEGGVDLQERLDTVGAICLDDRGEIAAGVSSGGISLKFPGRIGQAATFCCGCWADDSHTPSSLAVACSTSGTGEYIMKTLLAKECALGAAAGGDIHGVLERQFLCSKALKNVDLKLAGVITVNLEPGGAIQFSWGHTTESMCVGHMSAEDKEPTAFLSALDSPEKAGRIALVGGVRMQPRQHT